MIIVFSLGLDIQQGISVSWLHALCESNVPYVQMYLSGTFQTFNQPVSFVCFVCNQYDKYNPTVSVTNLVITDNI